MTNSFRRLHLLFLVLSLVGISCNKINNVFKPESPREEYANGLQKSPLAGNVIVQEWHQAADSVLTKPLAIEIPFQTKVVYFSDEAHAWAWQFSLPQGRRLRLHFAKSDTAHDVFVDLFSIENGTPQLKNSIQDSVFSYTADNAQSLIIRMQAELLVNGSATLTLTDNPSMEFPVQGGIRADIGSFWGDPRDAGRRQHKGVDIFAERGTPVVATTDGWVTRTGNRGLGGKQVWLRADGKSMYYAHLDSIDSKRGQQVSAGDTLGFVGNSGNARTTPPHLHFAIYDRGAINPLPFIDFAKTNVEPMTADPNSIPKWGRIASAKANVRPLPSTQKPPFTSLTRHNPVQIIGGIGEWYHVELPGGERGFIYHTLLEAANTSLGNLTLRSDNAFYSTFSSSQPFIQSDSAQTIDYFGEYKNRQLAKFVNRWVWIN